jgi:nicotinamidase-related amidase
MTIPPSKVACIAERPKGPFSCATSSAPVPAAFSALLESRGRVSLLLGGLCTDLMHEQARVTARVSSREHGRQVYASIADITSYSAQEAICNTA